MGNFLQTFTHAGGRNFLLFLQIKLKYVKEQATQFLKDLRQKTHCCYWRIYLHLSCCSVLAAQSNGILLPSLQPTPNLVALTRFFLAVLNSANK